MRTFFTLLLATFLSSPAFAYGEGRLSISIAYPKNVVIVIDGRNYQPAADRTIDLSNLRPGNHSVRIYNNNRYNNRYDGRNRIERPIYSATIEIRSFHHVDIMINRFGKALIDERDMRYADDYGDGRNDDDYRDDYNRPMSDRQFKQLVENIKNKWIVYQKMDAARDALKNEYFTTLQVRQILELFSTDNEKLELAKLAYNRTVDRRRFYTLYDVFSFRSSREELERYIKERR